MSSQDINLSNETVQPPRGQNNVALQAQLPPAHLKEENYVRNATYAEATVFEQERERIFYRTWNLVLHESELVGVGSFRTVEIAGIPIVVCRDDKGKLRAFYNICRHRGCTVVTEERGCTNRFRCPYHLWNYSLSGEMVGQGLELKGTPQPQGYNNTGFDRKNFPLVEIPVGSALGLIFVNLDQEAEPLETFLAGVLEDERIISVLNGDLDVFHFHQQIVNCNWKLFVDNSREGYHVNLHEFVRRTSPELLDVTNTAMKWHDLGRGHLAIYADDGSAQMNYGKMNYDNAEGSKLSHPLPGMSQGGLMILHLFPDIMINVRSSAIRIDRMVPLACDKTLLEWRGLGLKGDTPDVRRVRIANHNTVWGPFGRQLPEDVAAVEWQMNALRHGHRAISYSIIARHANLTFTDDIEVREFYKEWKRLMEVLA